MKTYLNMSIQAHQACNLQYSRPTCSEESLWRFVMICIHTHRYEFSRCYLQQGYVPRDIYLWCFVFPPVYVYMLTCTCVYLRHTRTCVCGHVCTCTLIGTECSKTLEYWSKTKKVRNHEVEQILILICVGDFHGYIFIVYTGYHPESKMSSLGLCLRLWLCLCLCVFALICIPVYV